MCLEFQVIPGHVTVASGSHSHRRSHSVPAKLDITYTLHWHFDTLLSMSHVILQRPFRLSCLPREIYVCSCWAFFFLFYILSKTLIAVYNGFNCHDGLHELGTGLRDVR
jgi:hypothetical protein